MEGKVGGSISCDFGSGIVAAKITAWQPLVRFCTEADGWMPGMPAVATEWSVQALDGGTCKVRVVHSLFASTDDWDGQLEGTESGFTLFLGAFACGGAMASLQTYVYGKDATRIADDLRSPLSSWLGGLFPAPTAP